MTRPNARTSEALLLFTMQPGATAGALQQWARGNGIAELSVPKVVHVVDALPVRGTGTPDDVTKIERAAGSAPALATKNEEA